METRRGKYWESDPVRQKKAEEKRERRKVRNMKLELAEKWRAKFPFTYGFQGRRLSDIN
jgi:hypothetical protein